MLTIDIVSNYGYDDFFYTGVNMPASAERAVAKKNGEKTFFTGRPCMYGHVSHRYTAGGSCATCVGIRQKEVPQKEPTPEQRKLTNDKWNASPRGYQAKMRWKERDPKNAWACSAAGGARARAKKFDLACDVDKEYIRSILTDMCPVFGTPFVWYGKKLNAFSPSLDRIRPELGYVRGNVVVISQRANAIKSDASAEEIAKVLEWLQILTRP